MNTIRLLRQIARDAIRTEGPCDIIYATYLGNALRIDALPLDLPLDMVNIPSKMQKIEGKITCALKEGEGVEIEGSGSVRSIKLTDVPVTITLELKPGDHVLAARHKGGQKFTILDKY
ncbi:MAG: DUF2577 family protein [Candidatus Fimivivens sp.]|nr:DUF2577 family protein [Candidatus Fimivivens sp.]